MGELYEYQINFGRETGSKSIPCAWQSKLSGGRQSTNRLRVAFNKVIAYDWRLVPGTAAIRHSRRHQSTTVQVESSRRTAADNATVIDFMLQLQEMRLPITVMSNIQYKQGCVQLLRTLTTWHYPHSPAVHRAAIDRCLLPTGPQRKVCCCGPCCDKRTDGRAPDRCIDLVPYGMRTVPITLWTVHLSLTLRCHHRLAVALLAIKSIYCRIWTRATESCCRQSLTMTIIN